MKSGTTRTLGVVISDIQLTFFAQAVRGIADAARAEDFEVILANTRRGPGAERAAVGVLVDKRVDGLIVVPAEPAESASHLREAQDRGIPVVLLDRGCAGDPLRRRRRRQPAGREERASATSSGSATAGSRSSSRAETALTAADVVKARLRTGRRHDEPPPGGGLGGGAPRAPGCPSRTTSSGAARYDRDDARRATAAGARAPRSPDGPRHDRRDDDARRDRRDPGRRPRDPAATSRSWPSTTCPGRPLIRPPLTVVAQPVHELGALAARHLIARIGGADGPAEVSILDTRFMLRGSTAAPAAKQLVTTAAVAAIRHPAGSPD